MKLKSCLFLWLILLIGFKNLPAQTLNLRQPICGYESGVTFSTGAYKGYANAFIYLKSKGSTPIFQPQHEWPIYHWLLRRLHKPRYLVFQATAYPLAFLSSELETFHPEQFNRFKFMGMNLMRSVGSGYEEPYALSLILGNLAFLGYNRNQSNHSKKVNQSGSAIGGLSVTTAHVHIHDNIQVKDRWWQYELILTGMLQEPKMRKINWNFRIGAKIHGNNLARDVAIFYFQRSHTDWQNRRFSIIRNSRFQYEAHFPINDGWRKPYTIRQFFSYSKKFPFQTFGYFITFRLGGGLLWEHMRNYDHQERKFAAKEESRLMWLIQPSLEF